jgi:hypothetical protein
MLIPNLCVNDSALASNARVNHRDVDCTRWKPAGSFCQNERPAPDIASGDRVRNIDNLNPRIDRKNHALHGGHVSAALAEIGCQRYDCRRSRVVGHSSD